jgi:hypothetical protein
LSPPLPEREPVAFGLRVAGAGRLLPFGRTEGAEGSVAYNEVPLAELARYWTAADSERRSQSRGPDGELDFTLDYSPGAGYRLWARSYGCCIVSRDGRAVAAAPAASSALWRAFLVGQVLPLCAALQGIEPFHASAVAWDDGAVGFVAPSGVGKTSLAVHSALRGASFLADDVLAVSLSADGAALAHPGTPRAALRPSEAARLRPAERLALGPGVDGERDRAEFELPLQERPLPLRALYFLERVEHIDEVRIAEESDPRLLLAASFVFAVRDPDRLVRQLDLCAALSRQAVLAKVQVPPSVGARELAGILERTAVPA